MEGFRRLYVEDWKALVKRFGFFGSKKRYTVSTYFSNRLDVYSQKLQSILVPFTRYKQGKFEDYRKTTEEDIALIATFPNVFSCILTFFSYNFWKCSPKVSSYLSFLIAIIQGSSFFQFETI
jgi:hypothetical protein